MRTYILVSQNVLRVVASQVVESIPPSGRSPCNSFCVDSFRHGFSLEGSTYAAAAINMSDQDIRIVNKGRMGRIMVIIS